MTNEKILVVDDDQNICEVLRLYLVKEGYTVVVANDGAQALERKAQYGAFGCYDAAYGWLGNLPPYSPTGQHSCDYADGKGRYL